MGRAVNPQGWPDRPDEVGRPQACAAYHPAEEAAFIAVLLVSPAQMSRCWD